MALVNSRIGIVSELAPEVHFDRGVRASGKSGDVCDAHVYHHVARAGAHPSAEEDIGADLLDDGSDTAVACTVAVDHLGGYYLGILDVVDLELLCPSEMLEYFSVLVGDCDLHDGESVNRY